MPRPFSPRRASRVLHRWLPLLGSLAAAAGCADDGPSNGAGGGGAASMGAFGGAPASELPYAPCAPDALVGQFVVELAEGFTRVDGQVSDAVLPSGIPELLASEGECRLLRPLVTTCTPACPFATEVCGPEGECVPLPRTRDVGTVTVRGLLVPLSMQANPITRSYANPAQPVLPHPAFSPGADLRIDSGGGDYAPFELRGWGVSPLVLSSEVIDVRRGQAARLAWQAPDAPGPARVYVNLNINFHGTSGARIECDFLDTGAAEIPASLIDGLFEQGISGNPTLTAVRRSATSLDIEPGCVQMLVDAPVDTPVQVEGVISCRRSSDCPPPAECIPVKLFCQ